MSEGVAEVLIADELPQYADHVPIPQPAAGAGAVFKLDSRWTWLLVALRFNLATSAAVANRFVSVDFADMDGVPWLRAFASAVQAAGAGAQEYDFSLEAFNGQVAAGLPIVARLPKVRIPGGWQLQVNVANVDVADQLSNLRAYVVKRETSS